jgi:hypothetical protein
MKKIYLSVAVLAMCMSSCIKFESKDTEDDSATTDTTVADTSATHTAATDTTAVTEAPRDSVAEEKAWMAYMTPTEPHKMMAQETGAWTADMTFWHGPGAPAEKAKSTADVKMILGGRYQEMNYKGNVMGMPFEGRSTLSYDNAAKEYTNTWIDNMGTGMMVAKGKMSGNGKTIEFKGEMVDPVSATKKPWREMYTIVDANTRKMEMFDTSGGKEFKSMEIVMKRKK